MSVSKKDRFEIFKRDGFRCIYCGKQPPEVTLELDHIHPKAKGGLDSFDNYCTSCFDCNRGKSDNLLSEAPPNAMERLAFLQEKLEDIQALKKQSKLARKIEKQEQEIRQSIVNYWCVAFGCESVSKSIVTVMYSRLRWIDLHTMRGLIEVCARKMRGNSPRQQEMYMSGILRKHLADLGIDFQTEVRK